MTSQLNVDTIVDKAGSGGTNVKIGNTSTYVSDGGAVTQNTVQGLGKAWCNLNGGSSFALRDSFNVASLTDAGTGRCKIVFTNVFSNDKFASTGLSGVGHGQYSLNGQETNLADHLTYDGNNSAADSSENTMVAHGDLA